MNLLYRILRNYVKISESNREVKFALYIEGSPGVGKTQIVRRALQGYAFAEISALALNEEDLAGLAYPANERLIYLKPFWDKGIDFLFIDEIGGVSTRKQQILLKIVSESCHADGTRSSLKGIIMAGNSIGDTLGDEFLRPFKMRIAKIVYEPKLDEFTAYLGTVGQKWSAILLGFLRKNPSIFMSDIKEEGVILAPRLLEYAARIATETEGDQEVQVAMLNGILYKFTGEFIAYLRDNSLLSYEEWRFKRVEYLKEHKDEPEKIALLSYAVPPEERIEFFKDLKAVQPQLYSGLVKEFASNLKSLGDDAGKYTEWLLAEYETVKQNILKTREDMKVK